MDGKIHRCGRKKMKGIKTWPVDRPREKLLRKARGV